MKHPLFYFFDQVIFDLMLDEALLKIIRQPRLRNFAIALYSFPQEDGFSIMVQDLSKEPAVNGNPEFWFHPYEEGAHCPLVVIRPHQLIKIHQDDIQTRTVDSDLWQHPGFEFSETSYERFSKAVDSAKAEFALGPIEKVMLSRITEFPLPATFDHIGFLLALRKEYANAFVSLISTPYTGTWIGATPEVLLQYSDSTLKTVSLAGTRIDGSESEWTAKEYHEQELVTKYIRNAFSGPWFKKITIDGPSELGIGNLLHLHTKLYAELSQPLNRVDFNRILKTLHPTPAVGGFPKEEGLDLVKELEKHHRYYYSGFLGPVDQSMNGSLFVNLRCMTLCQSKLAIYSGAGITSGSNPESEWTETTNKANMLLRVLRQFYDQQD